MVRFSVLMVCFAAGCTSEEPARSLDSIDQGHFASIVVHIDGTEVSSTTKIASESTFPMTVQLETVAGQKTPFRLQATIRKRHADGDSVVCGHGRLELESQGNVNRYVGDVSLFQRTGELELTLQAITDDGGNYLIYRKTVLGVEQD
jgi:hypothetical protein